MSADLQKFHCKGCNLYFTTDLEVDEVRFCLLCGTQGTLEIASNRLSLCSECGEAEPEHEMQSCPTCSRPMCNSCLHEQANGCRTCRAPIELIDMPVGRPC